QEHRQKLKGEQGCDLQLCYSWVYNKEREINAWKRHFLSHTHFNSPNNSQELETSLIFYYLDKWIKNIYIVDGILYNHKMEICHF
ncbi:hypothetical protein ACQP3C_27940, partial [Escherichia coli]